MYQSRIIDTKWRPADILYYMFNKVRLYND